MPNKPKLVLELTLHEAELLFDAIELLECRLKRETTSGQEAHWYAARYASRVITRLKMRIVKIADALEKSGGT